MIRAIALGLLSVLFVGAGTLHLIRAETFARIVPPVFPAPLLLVHVSGICEILGGIGIVFSRTRRWAGYGLVALLVAVFPANVYMAAYSQRFADLASPAILWWRLPLQPLLVAWVYLAAIKRKA